MISRCIGIVMIWMVITQFLALGVHETGDSFWCDMKKVIIVELVVGGLTGFICLAIYLIYKAPF